ncbi:hypothetical protein Tco_0238433 [Tanacetum coccineum]
MAAPGPSNVVTRRVVDDLIDFSGETDVPKFMKFFFVQQVADIRRFVNRMREEAPTARNCIAQLTALVAEIEAMDDQEEVFDTLMCLRDDIREENSKLLELNGGEFRVCGPLERDMLSYMFRCECRFSVNDAINLSGAGNRALGLWVAENAVQSLLCSFGLIRLTEIVDSSRLQDKMKVVFSRARSEDESFIGLMRDLCSGLRLSLTKNRQLIAELEALGQRGDALRSLDYMREMVVRDSATLEVLE